MEQLSFFAEAGQSKGLPEELLAYHAGFIDEHTSAELLQKFTMICHGSKVPRKCGTRNI